MFTDEFYAQIVAAAAKELVKEAVKEGHNFIRTKIMQQKGNSTASSVDLPNHETNFEDINQIDWTKIRTIYWLGNDLMWINDMIYRGASPERVKQGIDHVEYYIQRLGFHEKSFPMTMLSWSRDALSSVLGLPGAGDKETQVIKNAYSLISHYIEQIKFFLDAAMGDVEPDFIKMRS